MDENFIINKYLKPLSKNFSEALNFSDDAAVLKVFKYKNLVITSTSAKKIQERVLNEKN